MPLRLDAAAPGFDREFAAFLGRNRDAEANKNEEAKPAAEANRDAD